MTESENTSVYILGSGAIGKALYGLLLDYKPQLLSFSASKAGDIKLDLPDIHPSKLELRVEQLSDQTRLSSSRRRILFICQKALAIPRTVSLIGSLCDDKDIAVILSNGIGVYEEANKIAPHLSIVRMAANFGARIINEDRIALAGAPAFSGVFSDLREKDGTIIRSMFSSFALLEEQTVKDLEWNKTCVNFLVNSLCTIVRGDNSTLFLPELSQLSNKLFEEYQQVAEAEGVKLRLRNVNQVHQAVATYRDNINSTLQDVLRGSETEINYIVKPVLEAAKSHSIPVPLSKTIYQLLLATEKIALAKKDSDEKGH